MRENHDAVGESGQKTSYNVDQLVEQGFVDRRPSGRTKHVYLTDVGRLYLQWTAGN